MLHKYIFWIAAWMATSLLAAFEARASGGSYTVDDASITPAGRCQLESWMQAFKGGSLAGWTVPACSFGALELSLGLSRQIRPNVNTLSPGVKWLLHDGGDAGISAAWATTLAFYDGQRSAADSYIAFSAPLDRGQRWQASLNLGGSWLRSSHARVLIGAGLEYIASPELGLLAEYLRPLGNGYIAQAGARFYLGDNSIDLLAGQSRSGVTSRWVTLGLNLAF